MKHALVKSALLASVLLLSGCAFLARPGKVKLGNSSAEAPANAQAATTISTDEGSEVIDIPAGTQVSVTETANDGAKPASRVFTYAFINASQHRIKRDFKQAEIPPQRPPDTSVDKHKIDVAERRWLLFAAIGAGIAAVVLKSMLPGWGGLSNGMGAGAIILFAAWKFSEVPWWASLIVVGIVAAMALGYKRAEWDKNGDGIPDILQKK